LAGEDARAGDDPADVGGGDGPDRKRLAVAVDETKVGAGRGQQEVEGLSGIEHDVPGEGPMVGQVTGGVGGGGALAQRQAGRTRGGL
jgi:hypothetical protein